MGKRILLIQGHPDVSRVKSLERNILGFVGIAPVHETLIGMVGNREPELAEKWLTKLEKLGKHGG